MTNSRFSVAAVCLTGLLFAPACTPSPVRAEPASVPLESARAASPQRTGRPAAVIAGSSVSWEDLHPALSEAAGRVVLEELALDRALSREASRRGIVATEAMVRAEEDALLDELAVAGPIGSRVEVLERIRLARGLGATRFEGLLRRNAILRAMVAGDSQPSVDEIGLAGRIAFGAAYRVRLFVSASDADAARARSRVASAEAPVRDAVMALACVDGSSHASSARGGLIERLSPADPAYPDVVRDAVGRLAPGDLSPVLATPGGFAVLLMDETIDASDPSAAERERVERRVRVRKERLAMERLAVELLAGTEVSPIDPDLARAWRERR